MKIDDSLDVFPVHGVGGFTGLLLTAIFSATAGGLGLDDGATISSQLGVQAIGAVATALWCGIATYLLLKLVGAFTTLRATREEETEGLDVALHEERGYIL
jgi:Amt family ammonium transporter